MRRFAVVKSRVKWNGKISQRQKDWLFESYNPIFLTSVYAKKADKGMSPGIVSNLIENQQLFLTLHDSAGTYKELVGATAVAAVAAVSLPPSLVGATVKSVLQTKHEDFQIIATPFRKIKGFQ